MSIAIHHRDGTPYHNRRKRTVPNSRPMRCIVCHAPATDAVQTVAPESRITIVARLLHLPRVTHTFYCAEHIKAAS